MKKIRKLIKICNKPNIFHDKDQDGYYDLLSAFQKSIRGSDVDAALHYLAKLIIADDLQSLCRRLLCIAYEDISLANPGIGPKVKAACEAALELGMPEAKLPLASIVVEMALSPKSNSTAMAIDKVLEDIENGNTGPLPPHLKNVYSFEDGKEIVVKAIGYDKRGKLNLSRKEVLSSKDDKKKKSKKED